MLNERLYPLTARAIASKTSAPTPSGCIEWKGKIDRFGYPLLFVGKKMSKELGLDGVKYILVHRLTAHIKTPSFSIVRGPGDTTSAACHKCDNPKCIAVDHIEPSCQWVNMMDRYMKKASRDGGGLTRTSFLKARGMLKTGRPLKRVMSITGLSYNAVYRIRASENMMNTPLPAWVGAN